MKRNARSIGLTVVGVCSAVGFILSAAAPSQALFGDTPVAELGTADPDMCDNHGKPAYRLCMQVYNQAAFDIVGTPGAPALTPLMFNAGWDLKLGSWGSWKPGHIGPTNWMAKGMADADRGKSAVIAYQALVDSKDSQLAPGGTPMGFGDKAWFGSQTGRDNGKEICYPGTFLWCGTFKSKTEQWGPSGTKKAWYTSTRGVNTRPIRINIINEMTDGVLRPIEGSPSAANFLASYPLSKNTLTESAGIQPGATGTMGGFLSAQVDSLNPASQLSASFVIANKSAITTAKSAGSVVTVTVDFGVDDDGNYVIDNTNCTIIGVNSSTPGCEVPSKPSKDAPFTLTTRGWTDIYVNVGG